MPARTGKQFLAGLKADGREIWVGDERVEDATEHPAFRGAAHALAEVFDLQYQEADACLMPDPDTGELINKSHMIPRSKEDLRQRHRALETISEHTVGLMGRTPDYMNVTFAGFAGRCDEWAVGGNERGATNLVNFQKELARKDISLTHTIVHTTTNKAKGETPTKGDEDEDVAMHKVADTEYGIIVRGSRILATLAPFSDELAVYPGHPMPGASDQHALSFSIPMNTPGLRFICRDSFTRNGNTFDYPISSRFDEQDAFVIFDDVEIPKDRIFINANLDVYNAVMMTGWWPNIMHQTMIRAQTKLEFAWALATRMAETINATSQPATQQMLGEIRIFADLTRSAIESAEANAIEYGNGVWFPSNAPLAALRAMMPTWMPRVNEIIRLIGSHNHFTAPTAAQLADKRLRPLIDKYLRGTGVTAEQRARVFRLAWDFAASGLGSRNEQYERFYLGSAARNFALAQLLGDRTRGDRLVDRFLAEAITAQ